MTDRVTDPEGTQQPYSGYQCENCGHVPWPVETEMGLALTCHCDHPDHDDGRVRVIFLDQRSPWPTEWTT